MLKVLIMSGGIGSRLWPLSRPRNPKQFISIVGDQSLFQSTLKRVRSLSEGVMVVCSDDQRFLVAEQARSIDMRLSSILLEPVARNTAAAIGLAAVEVAHQDPEAILLVLPSDHVVGDEAAFQSTVLSAKPLAEAGRLVTFGVMPTHPETGYGYIQAGQALVSGGYDVARFVEKPDLPTAQSYLAHGGYYWNSGMFMFKASVFLQELERWVPDVLQACKEAVATGKHDMDFFRAGAEAFAASPSISVDYAVMEKTDLAAVVPLDAGWNDVGAWSSVWQVSGKDKDGNATQGDVMTQNAHGNLVHASHRLVTLLGVNDLVVVETSDAVMVTHKDKAQDVKQLVDRLNAAGRPEAQNHRKVYRPWGSYDSVDQGERFQVKRIVVTPGAKLSVQMHHHRAEHWVVVSGTAKVRIGDQEQFVTENQSVYIPVGVLHSLENPGKLPLHLIEVQSGSYLGEDDIVRFEDRYGRV